ncbi:MAG: [protein-PII] uridylyltransferase [Salinisphaeraceae bacterium]|nr:[protein-PII] uridylyltransferase [Salinisphaeraceae bacterium]
MSATDPKNAHTELFDAQFWSELDAQVDEAANKASIAAYKACLKWGLEAIYAGFDQGISINDLVSARTRLVDQVLCRAWRQYLGEHANTLALIAVGGYGRGELLPHSDIDLLILHEDALEEDQATALQGFLTFLWDIGLEIGQSVRTAKDCADEARNDLTVMTNMLESRQLDGAESLFQSMHEAIATDKVWPVDAFFAGKLKEQQQRHAKYEDTAYKLEPNVKESPGGLRDIQTIAWVAKRHFDAQSLNELVDNGFLTAQECRELLSGQAFLWRVRFALHRLTGRREDRLLFDHQLRVAELFGYSDSSHNLAVEQFMQRYYRSIKALSCLNDLLLQLFEEAIVHADDTAEPTPINRRFQSRHGFIEVRHPRVFEQNPFALLEIFYLLQQDRNLTGIRAETLRLIRRSRELIDDDFRQDIRARSFFMEIMRNGDGLTRALRRMNRYGVLGRYIPAFGNVIGRMQYDLFHTLTVDEHTLFVVRNLRRMAMERFSDELPFCHEVMQLIPKPELLYLAGFFHDIAKGRGGDHSELGADDAREFCLEHGLSSYDSELVAWLVRNHLLMSMTAQRKDISDPEVIHEFATAVKDRNALDYIFLLTVADIRATNPELWNSWRESLLTGLYHNTARALERGLDDPIREQEMVAEAQKAARVLLGEQGIDDTAIDEIWKRIQPDYFRRTQPEEIAWATAGIHHCADNDLPLVLVDNASEQGTSVFVYTRDADYLFGLLTGVLAQLGLTILDARISSTSDQYTLDTYVVAEMDGSRIASDSRLGEIRKALRNSLLNPEAKAVTVRQRVSRQLRHFSVPTQVHFSKPQGSQSEQYTMMELVTADRPGLLSTVGEVFRQNKILVHTAKIGTIGERAEDVFYISDLKHKPLKKPALFHQLRYQIADALDNQGPQNS